MSTIWYIINHDVPNQGFGELNIIPLIGLGSPGSNYNHSQNI